MAAWNSFSCICSRALHSLIYFAHCSSTSTVIPLLHMATFTPSITNLGLLVPGLRLLPPSSLFFFIWYSSILSIWPSYLDTLWSALLARKLLFYSSSPTHLFIPNSIHSLHSNQTSQTLHLKNIHFPSLSTSHTPCLCSLQRRSYNNYYSFILTLLGLYPQ